MTAASTAECPFAALSTAVRSFAALAEVADEDLSSVTDDRIQAILWAAPDFEAALDRFWNSRPAWGDVPEARALEVGHHEAVGITRGMRTRGGWIPLHDHRGERWAYHPVSTAALMPMVRILPGEARQLRQFAEMAQALAVPVDPIAAEFAARVAIDPARRSVAIEGVEAVLPRPADFALFRLVIEARGSVVSREDIEKKIPRCPKRIGAHLLRIDSRLAKVGFPYKFRLIIETKPGVGGGCFATLRDYPPPTGAR